ncbi:hypothetical protein PybrP1_010314 [[Pythium] brassicae (nom. inval.)]|nr:hypothetical protein PybrP1_010314 [[Pythium] brassicae (nom. inval.)]
MARLFGTARTGVCSQLSFLPVAHNLTVFLSIQILRQHSSCMQPRSKDPCAFHGVAEVVCKINRLPPLSTFQRTCLVFLKRELLAVRFGVRASFGRTSSQRPTLPKTQHSISDLRERGSATGIASVFGKDASPHYIRKESDKVLVVGWITATAIIHKILESIKDTWRDGYIDPSSDDHENTEGGDFAVFAHSQREAIEQRLLGARWIELD